MVKGRIEVAVDNCITSTLFSARHVALDFCCRFPDRPSWRADSMLTLM